MKLKEVKRFSNKIIILGKKHFLFNAIQQILFKTKNRAVTHLLEKQFKIKI